MIFLQFSCNCFCLGSVTVLRLEIRVSSWVLDVESEEVVVGASEVDVNKRFPEEPILGVVVDAAGSAVV